MGSEFGIFYGPHYTEQLVSTKFFLCCLLFLPYPHSFFNVCWSYAFSKSHHIFTVLFGINDIFCIFLSLVDNFVTPRDLFEAVSAKVFCQFKSSPTKVVPLASFVYLQQDPTCLVEISRYQIP